MKEEHGTTWLAFPENPILINPLPLPQMEYAFEVQGGAPLIFGGNSRHVFKKGKKRTLGWNANNITVKKYILFSNSSFALSSESTVLASVHASHSVPKPTVKLACRNSGHFLLSC